MKKIAYALAALLSSLALAADPPGKTEQVPNEDQPAMHRPDDVDAKTERPKTEAVTPQGKNKQAVDNTRLSAKDIETLAKLHSVNLDEIAMGKLAKKSGSSKQVKAFGDLLIKDHTLADKQIVAYAKKAGVDLSPRPTKDEQELAELHSQMDTMGRIETLKGEEFDKAFTKMMVEGHTDAVKLIEGTLTATTDPQLHSLLGKILPVIKEHLKVAEKLEKRATNV